MKILPWAVAFAARLFTAKAFNTSGFDPVSGHPQPPNPAAMWPPHRAHPTMGREKRGRDAHVRMTSESGRVTIKELPPKLAGGKGLRP